MADYMYHDYDGETEVNTKFKKWRSVIGTVICVLWFVALGLFLALRGSETVRTDYPEIAFSTHSTGEKITPSEENEFVRLKNEFQSTTAQRIISKEMLSDYPSLETLISLDELLEGKNPIYHFDAEGYLTVVETYIDYQNKSDKNQNFDGIVGMDILMIPYTTDSGYVVIDAPERYCLKYDLRDGNIGTIAHKEFISDSFRLNFYNLAVTFSGELNKLDYTLRLGEFPTKWECDNLKLFNCLTVNGNPGTLIGSHDPTSKTVSGECEFNGTQVFKIEFDKRMYRKFESVQVGNEKCTADFTITINEGVE
ncbi:MAG: hypothetical protein II366_01750 [Clostridia bacterium]|nr:hypothetical protein [Clostridia bacterium]